MKCNWVKRTCKIRCRYRELTKLTIKCGFFFFFATYAVYFHTVSYCLICNFWDGIARRRGRQPAKDLLLEKQLRRLPMRVTARSESELPSWRKSSTATELP